MNDALLKQCRLLQEIIKTTEKALNELKEVTPNKARQSDNQYDDGLYNLAISQHSDGSGFNANLTRYNGNAQLLKVIIDCLEGQLADYKAEYESL